MRVTKGIKKSSAIIGGILLIIAVAFVSFKLVSDHGATKAPASAPVSDENRVPVPKNEALDSYNTLLQSVADGKWDTALAQAKKTAEDNTVADPLRITAYANCVYAATKLQDTASANSCKVAGEALIAKQPPIRRPESQKAFDAVSTGTTTQSTANGDTQ